MLKSLHYLSYKGDFYLCAQRKANRLCRNLRSVLDVFGSFAVIKCYNWLSDDAVASLLYADMFQLYLSSLTVARIFVSLTLSEK